MLTIGLPIGGDSYWSDTLTVGPPIGGGGEGGREGRRRSRLLF